MKVKSEVLENVRKNTRIRREIARNLDISDATISRHLTSNAENGELTKAIVLKVISIHLNIPESLILEE